MAGGRVDLWVTLAWVGCLACGGKTELELSPTGGTSGASTSVESGHGVCSLAGAPDGSLYLQTYDQLWRIWPE